MSDEDEPIRLVATTLETPRHQWMDETIEGGRGPRETSSKDPKLFLPADRPSCHQCEAHQVRVLRHSAAYGLMHALRSHGLRGTAWGKAQLHPRQRRLLHVGARVEALQTKVQWHFPSSLP